MNYYWVFNSCNCTWQFGNRAKKICQIWIRKYLLSTSYKYNNIIIFINLLFSNIYILIDPACLCKPYVFTSLIPFPGIEHPQSLIFF